MQIKQAPGKAKNIFKKNPSSVLVSQSGRRDRLPRSSAHANPNPLANIRQGVRHRPLYIAQRPPGITTKAHTEAVTFCQKEKQTQFVCLDGRQDIGTSGHQADSR